MLVFLVDVFTVRQIEIGDSVRTQISGCIAEAVRVDYVRAVQNTVAFIDCCVNSACILQAIRPLLMGRQVNISSIQDDIVKQSRLTEKDRISNELLEYVVTKTVQQQVEEYFT